MSKWANQPRALTMTYLQIGAIVIATIVVAALVPAANGFRSIELNNGGGRKLFGGYRITPKHCRATKTLPMSDPRSTGPTICMFNHECAQRNGEVVGACMDGFLFGACCQIPLTQELESTLITDAQNTYYQQHQQQKLQLQQAVSNPAAAQSYESYGESIQSQEIKYPEVSSASQEQHMTNGYGQRPAAAVSSSAQEQLYQQENIDKVYQQLGSSTSGYVEQSQSVQAEVQHQQHQEQQHQHTQQQQMQQQQHHIAHDEIVDQQQETLSSDQEADKSNATGDQQTSNLDSQQSASNELEVNSQLHTESQAGASNTIADNPPPQFHVNKGSVKISSPSSPPQNDDFVMQVLSTLSPDLANDQITFTTEVPMKISNSLTEQTSSESNSFEEMPSATQMTPVKSSMVKPTASPGMQHKDDASEVQSEETQQSQSAELEVQSAEKQSSTLKPTKQQLQQEQHKQQQEQLQQQQQQLQQQQQQQHQQQQQQLQQQQLHLQQQQHQQHQQQQEQLHQHQQQQILQQQHQEQHQEQHQHNHNHLILSGGEFTHSDITHPGADADLVEDDLQFSTGYGPQPVYVEAPSKAANVPSTTVKIPSANQEYGSSNNNSPTTSSSITTHVDSIESIILQLNNSNQGPAYTVVKQQTPSYSTSDDSSSNSYEATAAPSAANPTAAPANIYHDDVETKRPMDVPAYLETVTTKLNLESQSSSMMENVYPSPKPTPGASDSDASYDTLEDHTMPEKNYIDTSSSSHQTSDFNKMPQGVAYPVDMSYMEEEGNLLMDENEQQGYGGLVPTSQRPVEMTTTTSSQKTPEEGEMQSRPIVSYIGVVTSQTFNKKQPAPAYNQLPQEVTVSSHSTKVQEQYDTSSPSYQQNQPQYAEKLTTVSYVESPTTVSQSDRIATTTPTYVPSSTILTSLPHYVASTYDATTSTTRPVLVTAAGTQKPRPRPKPSTKRPASIQRVTKPPSNKKPAKPISTYIQEAQETNYQQQSVNQQSGYDQIVKKPASQPSPVYHDDVEIETKKPATTKPSKRPSTHSTHVKTKKPSATTTTTKHQYQTTPSYNSEVSNTQQQDYPARPIIQENTSTKYETGSSASVTYNQDPYTPSASSANRRPVSNDMAQSKPISTSYVTGPTSPRPSSTFSYQDGNGPSIIINDDKLNAFVLSTAQSVVSMSQTPASYPSTYQSASYGGSVTPSYQEQKPYTNYKKPGFVKVQPQSTQKPPLPTVLITPKPTVINLVTASSWANTNKVDGSYGPTTPIPGFSSTSYVYSPMVTRRPDFAMNTPEYVNVPAMSSNDFDDPGYYGGQGQHVPAPSFTNAPTDATYAVPSDDRPAFPGYYGPTPTYPAFHVPGEKVGSQLQQDEETFTSPNDFVNFPPVRNPNLNMSATSSSVTTDIELSTPAFVEDGVLKDKMNTLVHKIVESLQGNFDALADLIDEGDTKNGSAPIATYHSPSATASSAASTAGTTTRKPTRKATQRVTTARPKPKPTTRKPVTRVSTKAPTKRVTITTRKPATRRPTTTTRKPTRRVTSTTTQKPLEDEIVDEEDEEDVNPSANEVDQDETLSGAGGRKFKCGVRPHIKSGRIVGGKGSTFGAYPWQVLVRESTWLGLFTKNKCGGVLITSRYVITAAHCQPGFLASLVAVMGEFDISGDLESKRAVTKNVKRVIVHRQYDPATFENDLALLELDSPVQFDTHIVPICMPSDVADFTGRMATVTGWGRLKYGGGVPSVLQEVQVPVIENSVCQEMFHTAGHNKKILNSFLCAGYANGQKDSCEGDSGGPLVLQRPDGRYELAGTVSHGIKCAAPYLPGVYMRTTFYKPWLRSITGVK